MFSMKLLLDSYNNSEVVTANVVANKLISYISDKFNWQDSKTTSSNYCVELVSGREVNNDPNNVVVELVIRKHIVINKDSFRDETELSEYLEEIFDFCNQAKVIENKKI